MTLPFASPPEQKWVPPQVLVMGIGVEKEFENATLISVNMIAWEN